MIKAAHLVLVAGAVLLVVALAGSIISDGIAGADALQAATSSSDACCFTNPRFTGVCSVVPGEGESCASILAYLNNPNSSGKAYCDGTSIRGGWQQVSCEEQVADVTPPDLR